MWETLLGILIALAIPLFFFLIAYFSFYYLYKKTIKPKVFKNNELENEINILKQRVKLLEEKLREL